MRYDIYSRFKKESVDIYIVRYSRYITIAQTSINGRATSREDGREKPIYDPTSKFYGRQESIASGFLRRVPSHSISTSSSSQPDRHPPPELHPGRASSKRLRRRSSGHLLRLKKRKNGRSRKPMKQKR